MGNTAPTNIGRKSTLILLVFLSLLLMVQVAFAVPEGSFLGLSEIEKGMQGVGKTVVKGQEISQFSVEVIDVIDKPGELEDFIIVRASGEAIDKAGGVAQGMSGSPIYIDEKLVGALSRSATWSRETEKPIALVTPIKTMLKLFEENNQRGSSELEEERESSVKDSLNDVFTDKTVAFSRDGATGTERGKAETEKLVFTRTQTPVMVNGFSEVAFRALSQGIDTSNLDRIYDPLELLGDSSLGNFEDGLSEYDLSFHNVQVDASKSDQAMDLTPGGPVGVALTQGDFSIGALGTVTYREENGILGFGHRFLLGGNSNYILTRANVFDTVDSYQAPFKLGSVASSVGTVTQDRTQGVLGEVGTETNLFDTNIDVTEMEMEASTNFQTDLVKTSDLVGVLSYVTLRESINRALNRRGPGTVKVSYEITGENMPQSIKRSDIFFSHTQASFLPSLQVALFIDALAHNPFRNPELVDLQADVAFQNSINSGQITYFATDGNQYHPGDLLAYQVKIKNYRDDLVEKTGAFQIPENIPEGKYIVAVYGGPRPTKIAPPEMLENFEDWLSYLNNLKSYEHLSVELLKPLEESVVPMASIGYIYESVTRVDEKFEDRVIYGNQAVAIKITQNQEEKEETSSPVQEEEQGTES
ncbi:MAG: SpoIVB peptidase S55 domain-containing protein [Candidatus Bipolaricaulota bacterium]